MVEIVQILGDTADLANAYVGPPRELRVDTSNWDLRIHDGSTPGGHRLINRDNADARYQAKSPELSGIGPYAAQDRGFLVRRGAGDYELRELLVTSDNELVVTYPDGYGGDPTLALADTISRNKTFSGTVTVDGALTGAGGVIGNLTGNTAGTHTGPVVGNVTGNLAGNVTGNVAGTLTGSFDVSAGTINFAAGQIPTAAINGLAAYVAENFMPVGTILLWSGSLGSIPTNWHLCDGTTGTPNLMDRFVVGAGNSYSVAQTGGSATSSTSTTNNGSHSHGGSSADSHVLTQTEIPSHNHSWGLTHITGTTATSFADGGDNAVYMNPTGASTGATGGGGGHTHTLTLVPDGTHNHTVVTSTIPPYYALAYIMKVS